MANKSAEQQWHEYRERDLARVTPELQKLGIAIDEEQPHLVGERHLLQTTHDVGGGGHKLVLLGIETRSGKRVVIKATSDPEGKKEIEKERRARATITGLNFSYTAFRAPQEFIHTDKAGVRISVTEFIEQTSTFLDRPIAEQFALILKGLKVQEGVHATTYSHAQTIKRAFGSIGADEYIAKAKQYAGPGDASALKFLEDKHVRIEQYCGFLTHADFVPHNLRIRDGEIYLLDYASIHFGNKHESWARLMNFMLLYNPELERALDQYIKDNRALEEYESLQALRVYKLLFLLYFYRTNLPVTEGSLRTLTEARIAFWTKALVAVQADNPISTADIAAYKQLRDSLRSPEELKRQENLH